MKQDTFLEIKSLLETMISTFDSTYETLKTEVCNLPMDDERKAKACGVARCYIELSMYGRKMLEVYEKLRAIEEEN